MNAPVIRVVVAEDMTVLREALVALLDGETDIEVVAEAGSGDEALRQIAAHDPDIVLLDIGLPVLDGLSVARRLHEEKSGTRVVVLSALDRPSVVRSALSSNVCAFLPKGVSVDALVAAIRRVRAGEVVIDSALLATALSAGENPLAERERTVLRHMAEGDTTRDVARNLHLACGTISNTMTRVLQKLNARNKVDAIRIAREHDWLETQPPA